MGNCEFRNLGIVTYYRYLALRALLEILDFFTFCETINYRRRKGPNMIFALSVALPPRLTKPAFSSFLMSCFVFVGFGATM